MASLDTIAPLQILKTKGSQTPLSNQSKVAALVEYTKSLLDAEDQQHAQVAEAANGQVSHGLSPGATVDLSKRSMHELPVEVIELMRDRVERLALSHNPQVAIPPQIVKCDRLRYLNVRVNHLTEFPESILSLTQLEILDLSKNDLTSIPEDIKRMTSLKFLAIARNKISRLPIALGSMPNLHRLKFEDNPIVFPSLEELHMHDISDKNGATDVNRDTEVCLQVKKFMKGVMKSKALRQRLLKSSSEEDASESNTETPRPPRRLATGRFPVRPSISGVEGLNDLTRSASNSPPDLPPTTPREFEHSPSRNGLNDRYQAPTSHHDDAENGRLRSESISTSTSYKARRQGLLPQKRNNLSILHNPALQSIRSSNASTIKASHSYKASTSSTLSGISSGADSSTAASPNTAVSLQHHRHTSQSASNRPQLPPALVAARRLQRSLIHLSQPLLQVACDVTQDMADQSRLEKQVNVANSHTGDLDNCLHALIVSNAASQSLADAMRRLNGVLSATLNSYLALIETTRAFASRPGSAIEPYTARCLIFQLYSITVEARNVASHLRVPLKMVARESRDTPRASAVSQAWSSRTATPTDLKSNVALKRLRGATIIRNQPSTTSLRVVPPSRDRIRADTGTSFLNSASPMSAPLIPPTQLRSTGLVNSSSDEHDENSEQFEQIFLKLRDASSIAYHALPQCETEIRIQLGNAVRDGQHYRAKLWQKSSQSCRKITEMRKVLEEGLTDMQVGDPTIRNTKNFWQLCDSFVQSWTVFATDIKDIGADRFDITTVRNIMKPVQRAVKDVSKTISDSTLYHQALRGSHQAPRNLGPGFPAGLNTALAQSVAQAHPLSATPTSAQTLATLSMPATPLTAALGPAALATIASTPNTVSMNDYFPSITPTTNTSFRPPFERVDTSILVNGSSSAPQSATSGTPVASLGHSHLQQYGRR